MTPRPLRLLHTSDLHLGDALDAAEEPLRRLVRVLEVAREHEVDLVAIAGDLFDHNRLPQALLDAAAEELSRAGLPIVVLPGNHDPLVPESVYWRMALPVNVHLLREPDGETIAFPHLDLAVWGRPHTSYGDDVRPLADVPPRGGTTWAIAVAHGHWTELLAPRSYRRSYQITPDEIAASLRDYVALGHWDAHQIVSTERVTAAYSGSPGRHGATAVLVRMDLRDGSRTVAIEPLAVD